MATRRFVLHVTTAGDGTAIAYSSPLSGCLCAIHYVKETFADGVDFTISTEATGEPMWTEADVNASKTCRPRAPTHDNAGVPIQGPSDVIYAMSRLSLDRIKVVIAAGGAGTTGTFHFVMED